MTIQILSDPSHVIQVSPAIISRWLATECPNNFRMQRIDYVVTGNASSGGSPEYLSLDLAEEFTGNIGDVIAVYNGYNDTIYAGTVTDIASPATTITTDIPWEATFDATYLNNHTEYAGFYFEGRLTINDAVQPLTVIASPDSTGQADLDVSSILRIMTSVDKVGDYSSLIIAETNKSGKFTLAYRGCWYGSSEAYTEEGNTWYYVEAVRSIEQGSNLYEYVYTGGDSVPFFNSFTQPVYFQGLPFDLSFIVPGDVADGSPAAKLKVTIKRYNAGNTLLNTTETLVDAAPLAGYLCSLNIDPDSIESNAAFMTAEIETA
jgi:hypothetical protein